MWMLVYLTGSYLNLNYLIMYSFIVSVHCCTVIVDQHSTGFNIILVICPSTVLVYNVILCRSQRLVLWYSRGVVGSKDIIFQCPSLL